MGLTPLFTAVLGLLGIFHVALAADIVTGREFKLIDSSGRVTAQLTTSQEGTPSLFFYDKNGRVKLNLGIYADGAPTVVLFDDNNQASALLRLADPSGQPILIFKENGQDKMIIGLHSRSVIKPGGSFSQNSSPVMPSFISLIIAAIIGLVAGFIGSKMARTIP